MKKNLTTLICFFILIQSFSQTQGKLSTYLLVQSLYNN